MDTCMLSGFLCFKTLSHWMASLFNGLPWYSMTAGLPSSLYDSPGTYNYLAYIVPRMVPT